MTTPLPPALPLPLGLLLKHHRETSGRSQKAFAEALCLHQPQLSKLENQAPGTWNLRATEIIMIATVLGIPVSDVWASVYASYQQSVGAGEAGVTKLARNRVVVPTSDAPEMLPDGSVAQGVGIVGADGVMRVVRRVAPPDQPTDDGLGILGRNLDLGKGVSVPKRPGEATFLFKGVAGIPIDVSDIPLADDDDHG